VWGGGGGRSIGSGQGSCPTQRNAEKSRKKRKKKQKEGEPSAGGEGRRQKGLAPVSSTILAFTGPHLTVKEKNYMVKREERKEWREFNNDGKKNSNLINMVRKVGTSD